MDESTRSANDGAAAPLRFWTGAAIIALVFLLLAAGSNSIREDAPRISVMSLLLAAGLSAAGGAYLWMVYRTFLVGHDRVLLYSALAFGAALRVTMFFSAPILEDDFNRYLWDGAVLAHGFNPFRHAPEAVRQGPPDFAGVPTELVALGREEGSTLPRVNHGEFRSIYPMTAQAAFAAAHWLSPWSLTAWRVVLFAADLATLALLLAALRALGAPLLYCAIYWCNPLVIKEIFNSGHMDLIALPFVVGALLLAMQRRHIASAAVLAFAVGAKVWPILLLPLLLRPTLGKPARLLGGLLAFAGVAGVLFLPVFLTGLDSHSGFSAYSTGWQNNESIYRILHWGVTSALPWFGIPPYWDQWTTRIVVACLVCAWTALFCWRPIRDDADMVDRSIWIVAGLFLISPTQFPWYFVWMLPMLALRPRFSLLLYSALLPIYYLRYGLEPHGMAPIFENGLVWLEHGPVIVLLCAEWIRARREKKAAVEIEGQKA